MRLADIETWLRAHVTSLNFVGGAAAFTALQDGRLKKTASAFVVPGRERAAPSKVATGGIRQNIDVRFSVLLGFLRPGSTGRDGVERFDALRDEILNALIGWKAPGMADGITYSGYQVLGLDPKQGSAWFQIDFLTSRIIHKTGADHE